LKAFQYLAPIFPFEYVTPRSTKELLRALDSYGVKAKLLAGGTDLTIALKQHVVKPEAIIDLSHLRKELSGIAISSGVLRIGAMTTYTEIESDVYVMRFARALGLAASQIGTPQIRNLGTIGGNLANGSPAADTAPPLIALSAEVKLRSKHGERTVPVEEFFAGVKKTRLMPNEIVSSVDIPARENFSSHWVRVANRNENVLSIVSVAVASEVLGDRFGEARISLGAVAPTPILAEKSSSALSGRQIDEETIERAATEAMKECSPISDVRAGAEYRRQMVYVLTKRAIQEVAKTREDGM
jgi:aerobic carbon-monoxide dehydrogenase medium subunit